MAKAETALVKADDFTALSCADDMQEILETNLGVLADTDETLALPRVKFPTSGNNTFVVPTPDGEESEKTIRGIVLHHTPSRAYWPGEFAGAEPPVCSSVDGKVGRPGEDADFFDEKLDYMDCRDCPKAQWGSGGNGGQDCKALWRIWMLREGEMLPIQITLPPTSRNAWKIYMSQLITRGNPYFKVVTEVSLETTKNKKGIDYSKATFKKVGDLDEDAVAGVRKYRELIKPMVSQVPVEPTDYEGEVDL